MPTMEVEFEVFCSCGAGLCQQSVVENGRRGQRVTVEPCARCLERSKESGFGDGVDNKQDEINGLESSIEELESRIKELEGAEE